ncbi:MAG: type 2 isopentenyl-diphosphate Delta-isomerase [Myxococcales bacterium]|nr:type 2 isopentenyl-diphosphate Delta-isomerase [Myxococcales bacterium]
MPDPRAGAPVPIGVRKADHIALCLDGDVGFRTKTNLFDDVELVHDALPDLALDDIDLSTVFAGKTLRAPLIIAAMTGGTAAAVKINRDLARCAQRFGIGFAFGSQRPLLVGGVQDGYHVRDVAPDVLVLGNIGVVQARETSSHRLRSLVDETGCDALCVHLNPAMEVVQPGGDRDFRGGMHTIRRLVEELGVPIVVKETGCGLSRSVGTRLRALGVTHVDTSGAGGTSWVAVETARVQDPAARAVGERFRDWGIPTAASVLQLAGLGLTVCATGGVSNGLEIAKALALGATCGGVARPFLQAQARGDLDDAVQIVIEELRVACLLTGARSARALADVPCVIGGRLRAWAPAR